MPLLIHGIIGADAATALPLDALEPSIDDAPVRLVVTEQVCAVVSELADADVLPSRANLLGHTALLTAVAEHTTILPARFGLIAADETELREDHLEPGGDHLAEQLDRLAGTSEWRLRGRYDEAAVIAEVLADDRRAARLRGREDLEAKLELGERVTAGIEARRAVDLEEVERVLAPVVRELSAQQVNEPLEVFSVSVLVEGSAHGAFDDTVEALGARLAPRIGVELVGPLPPFSFVDEEATSWA